MKKQLSYGLALVLLVLITSPAMAGPVITFDENGNITGANYLGLQIDPISGIRTVTYGVGGTSGDLYLTEPGAPTGTYSDVLRWIGGSLYVFSDFETGEVNRDLADIGLPPSAQTNMVTMAETGLFGMPYTDNLNGIVYTPAAGQPGDMGNGVTYVFHSDIPEPSAMLMLATGMGIVGLCWHLRPRRAS